MRGDPVALTNEASWDRQPTLGRMFHGDSGKGEAEQKQASETLAAFCIFASQQQRVSRLQRKDSPFHVTRRRDSSSFVDDEFDLKECFIINASIMI